MATCFLSSYIELWTISVSSLEDLQCPFEPEQWSELGETTVLRAQIRGKLPNRDAAELNPLTVAKFHGRVVRSTGDSEDNDPPVGFEVKNSELSLAARSYGHCHIDQCTPKTRVDSRERLPSDVQGDNCGWNIRLDIDQCNLHLERRTRALKLDLACATPFNFCFHFPLAETHLMNRTSSREDEKCSTRALSVGCPCLLGVARLEPSNIVLDGRPGVILGLESGIRL